MLEAQLIRRLRVVRERIQTAPIASITFVPGKAQSGGHHLLVLGGQILEEPDVLTLLPLEASP